MRKWASSWTTNLGDGIALVGVVLSLTDPSSDAYDRVVDRLLESPHYGERWGRWWLDAARYALFQHMIANHDWSMRAGPVGSFCCHNAELLGLAAPGQQFRRPGAGRQDQPVGSDRFQRALLLVVGSHLVALGMFFRFVLEKNLRLLVH